MVLKQSRCGKPPCLCTHALVIRRIVGLNALLFTCQVAKEIESQGGEAIAIAGDVTAADFPQKCVEATVQRFGTIDILINNAGTAPACSLLDATLPVTPPECS